tara:strand:- start:11677 stop:12789 length:1113 start_codon:yes stop_codon:yes gene_type:complete
MKISEIKVKNKETKYSIFIGLGSLNLLQKKIKLNFPNTTKIGIVIDKNIPSNFKSKIKNSLKNYKLYVYEYSVNENLKSFNNANNLAENLLKNNFNRNDCVIAVGGGIIGDFASFVASIVKRGINFINIPSTLLAQVDSCIGGKTAVNSKKGKNLIGSFYQPKLVISELGFLKSLPRREMTCGFAEILKHSLIHDNYYFNFLKKNSKNILEKKNYSVLNQAITKSCKIKLHFVNQDEKEDNKRMILNFGHTFAHGIEAAKGFTKKINHGEAVLIGMFLASKLSLRKKICSISNFKKIEDVYFANNLPNKLSNYFSKKDLRLIVKFMARDKKNKDHKISLILLKKIGKTTAPGNFKITSNKMIKVLNNLYL